MAKFVTGKDLEDAVYDIIFEAKKQLLIVSPFIKLDEYFKQKVFNKHKINADLQLTVVFGKNEHAPERSFNKVDFDYFKEFPNVSVVYVPTLHAKYYANESRGVVTSINLYDHSFQNNIEFGVISESGLINIGSNSIDKDAWIMSMKVIADGYAVFIKTPNFKKKLFGKDYVGSTIKVDYTNELINGKFFPKVNVFQHANEEFVDITVDVERQSRESFEQQKQSESKPNNVNESKSNQYSPRGYSQASGKTISASKIAERYGVTVAQVNQIAQNNGWIDNYNNITQLGYQAGLELKNYMGKDYVAYPENHEGFLKIKNGF